MIHRVVAEDVTVDEVTHLPRTAHMCCVRTAYVYSVHIYTTNIYSVHIYIYCSFGENQSKDLP